MQETSSPAAVPSPDAPAAPMVSEPTALARALGASSASLQELGGARSVPVFSAVSQELAALVEGAGAFDLGYRGQIAVGGGDRLRWLNGMLTNAVQALREGTGNYNFVLNAQGRIQGDCDAYALPDRLLVVTERRQLPALLAHFDRFIVMDDVTLEDISTTRTALGLAGPLASQLLAALGVAVPALAADAFRLLQTRICGVPVELIAQLSGASPRFDLWCASENVRMLWDVLLAAGAVPCGLRAAEALRVLEGIPRYGVDIGERDLPQETGQTRALHFAKGCYLGQEIVERIRSRGQLHRRLAQFLLSTEPASLPLEFHAGRLTSVARYQGALYGLGIARSEAVNSHAALDYPGGSATLLTHSPLARPVAQL